jgi:hypothetical protein
MVFPIDAWILKLMEAGAGMVAVVTITGANGRDWAATTHHNRPRMVRRPIILDRQQQRPVPMVCPSPTRSLDPCIAGRSRGDTLGLASTGLRLPGLDGVPGVAITVLTAGL